MAILSQGRELPVSYIKTFAVGLIASSISSAFASDLLITEVVEGSSNNKAVEITNISAADVDLSSYNLAFYFNGNSNPSNVISLNGLLAQGCHEPHPQPPITIRPWLIIAD